MVRFKEGHTPTPAPTAPTLAPTSAPTRAPTSAPTSAPTLAPTLAPTGAPTQAPTPAPCEASCECFVERDPNFCNTCPACGPCVEFCDRLAPTSAPTSALTSVPTLAPANAPSQCLQFEAELVDTDMSGDLLAANPADSIAECCGMCEKERGCEGFAYAGKMCYLKGDFRGTFPSAG